MLTKILQRVTGLRNPPPTPTKEERLASWAFRYYSLPVEQRLRGVK